MEFPARDVLPGEVPEASKGTAAARTRLRPLGGAANTASIADEAADEPGLPGGDDQAHAVVEAPDVTAGKD